MRIAIMVAYPRSVCVLIDGCGCWCIGCGGWCDVMPMTISCARRLRFDWALRSAHDECAVVAASVQVAIGSEDHADRQLSGAVVRCNAIGCS